MPVERYRSAEEMNAAPIPAVPAEGFERFLRQCARYARIYPQRYPRGVFRFRSLEEAQAARARLAATQGHDPGPDDRW